MIIVISKIKYLRNLLWNKIHKVGFLVLFSTTQSFSSMDLVEKCNSNVRLKEVVSLHVLSVKCPCVACSTLGGSDTTIRSSFQVKYSCLTVANYLVPVVNSTIPEVLVQLSDDLRGLIARHRVVHHIKEVQKLTQPRLRVDCYLLSQRSASDPARDSYHLKHDIILYKSNFVLLGTTVETLITDLVHQEFWPLKSVLNSVTTLKIVCNATLSAWISRWSQQTNWHNTYYLLFSRHGLCCSAHAAAGRFGSRLQHDSPWRDRYSQLSQHEFCRSTYTAADGLRSWLQQMTKWRLRKSLFSACTYHCVCFLHVFFYTMLNWLIEKQI